MNANKLIPLILCIPFALVAYGCAEEREPLTDLEPSKEWGELTPEEKAGFCVDAEEYVAENIGIENWIDAYCLWQTHWDVTQNFSGDVDAAIQSCETRWALCRDEYTPMTFDYCPFVPLSGSCTATVEEWSDCTLDLFDQMEDLATKQCSDLTFEEGSSPISSTCSAEVDTCEE